MTIQELNARLASLFDTHKQTVNLINRLAKLPTQPGAEASTSDATDARIELGAEIHQSLKEQEEDLELLRQEIEDQTSCNLTAARRKDAENERGSTDLLARVSRLGENLSTARSQFRRAQLQAKRNAEAAKRKERELLFTGLQDGNGTISYSRRKGQEHLSKEHQVLGAASDVTAGLTQIYATLTQEISKSQFAKDTLAESTATLETLSEKYSNIDTLLDSSRNLVSSLLHSQKSDTWYLETAFWLLVVTIGWLVFRRILYGPGWWLLYLPGRLIWRLIIFNAGVVLNLFATIAGALGGAKQSSALSQASERISTSLTIKPSATGDFPRFQRNMPAPSIPVGAGGSGAKAPQQEPRSQTTTTEMSLSEQVGHMAEQSQQQQQPTSSSTNSASASQGTVLRERSSDEPPNPKKRMFEEPPLEAGQETRQRAEL